MREKCSELATGSQAPGLTEAVLPFAAEESGSFLISVEVCL
jgi:hypothetical protein